MRIDFKQLTLPVENTEAIPQPEAHVTGNGTRGGQVTFDGASFKFDRPTNFDRIIINCTAKTGAPTMRLLVYQSAYGLAGTANLVASCTGSVLTAGSNNTLIPTQGVVNLSQGLVYVLYGKEQAAGTFTLRTFLTLTNDLLNTSVDSNTHPVSFTTALSASTSPSTFNPITQTIPTVSDVVLDWRVRKT